MIIVQTPLRISFLGGGTDFPAFYRKYGGCVLSSTIDKYIFVIIKRRFDNKIRLGYTRTELVDSIDELQHELIREALRLTGIAHQVELSTMGDIPSEGSGLGSSSTVTVGCLNAMYAYLGRLVDAETLARQACQIEIDILGKPIGKQDQYIAAYGGLRFIRFLPDDGHEAASGDVIVESIAMDEEVRRALNERLLLFYTGVTRSAGSILREQVANIEVRTDVLIGLRDLAQEGREHLEAGRLDALGACMHRGWEFKRRLASAISSQAIDEMYEAARRAGALGGKITGAGGGGFMLLYCPPKSQDAVRYALRGLRELPFRLERDGSKVILNVRRD
ncbi:MAG: GHMP kinase [Chloroflexi bacterium]|nr:GHMP kinase [Chloroflexota bacterium]